MASRLKIVITGDPVPQGRMRHFSRGSYGGIYDPCKKYKDGIKTYLTSLGHPTDDYNAITMIFFCSIPKSMSKSSRLLAEQGMMYKDTRPDIDNYVKLYLDCMNGIIFPDDGMISWLMAEKRFHSQPRTVIHLQKMDCYTLPDDVHSSQ